MTQMTCSRTPALVDGKAAVGDGRVQHLCSRIALQLHSHQGMDRLQAMAGWKWSAPWQPHSTAQTEGFTVRRNTKANWPTSSCNQLATGFTAQQHGPAAQRSPLPAGTPAEPTQLRNRLQACMLLSLTATSQLRSPLPPDTPSLGRYGPAPRLQTSGCSGINVA